MNEKLPWLDEYKVFGIPETLQPYPDKPVYHILRETAEKYPDMGLIQLDYKLTYPRVKDHVNRLATALAAMGLKKGDRVATLLPTSIQFAIADYAIGRAGLVHVPSSSLEPPKNLEHKFTMGGPKVLICLDEYLDTARDVMEKTDIQTLIVTSLLDYSNTPDPERQDLKTGKEFWFTDLIKKYPPDPPIIDFDVEKDLETLLFTGGTTGLPKGCMLTHRNVSANSLQNLSAFGKGSKLIKGCISVLLGLPFFHSYGHIVLHTMTMNGFDQILIPDSRDMDMMIKMIKKHAPVMQFGVPTQFMSMAKEDLKGSGMLGMSGSAPLPPETQKQFEEKADSGIMEGYGLSEMGPVTHLNPSFLLRLMGGRKAAKISAWFNSIPGVVFVINKILRLLGARTFGKIAGKAMSLMVRRTKKTNDKPGHEKRGTTGIPFPDTEIKLVDVNTQETLSLEDMRAGKRGELCMKGPQRMLGYWPDPGTGLDGEGYVRTSDVVQVDEDGYFFVVDRTKDMIIVSGYKVYSREVDDLLYEHPGVELAATVGIPDPDRKGSERVAVFVTPNPDHKDTLTEESIKDFLKERVAKYAVPKVVKIIDQMPQTEVHKVNKKVLREHASKDFLAKDK